ncbi:MAG TPA: DUF4252 domain-containing protein [Bryobacteraceae bacterium]|nr:DUF4252 domain-containing protein [Bryobacteraceae bacterium]
MIHRRLIFLFVLAPFLVCGQSGKHARRTRAVIPQLQIRLDALDKLAEKASETVTVSLDGNLLQLASRFLSSDDPDQAQIKKLVASLKGVYVRNFEFEKTGEYQASDLEPIRSQLRDPKWKNIVQVRGRDNADVLLRQENEHVISGLAVIVAEPKELTVVYIDGPIDMDGLSKLAGNFGIPEDIGSKLEKEKEKDKDKDKEKKAK